MDINYTIVMLLSALGATHIAINGFIFGGVRKALAERDAVLLLKRDIRPYLLELLSCSMCTGFWVGVLIDTLMGFRFVDSYIPLLSPFLAGCASSFVSWKLIKRA